MKTLKVQGRADVAALLRQLADGVETGIVPIDGEPAGYADDMIAMVNGPESGLVRSLGRGRVEVVAHRTGGGGEVEGAPPTAGAHRADPSPTRRLQWAPGTSG
jgi:hypothetical protein